MNIGKILWLPQSCVAGIHLWGRQLETSLSPHYMPAVPLINQGTQISSSLETFTDIKGDKSHRQMRTNKLSHSQAGGGADRDIWEASAAGETQVGLSVMRKIASGQCTRKLLSREAAFSRDMGLSCIPYHRMSGPNHTETVVLRCCWPWLKSQSVHLYMCAETDYASNEEIQDSSRTFFYAIVFTPSCSYQKACNEIGSKLKSWPSPLIPAKTNHNNCSTISLDFFPHHFKLHFFHAVISPLLKFVFQSQKKKRITKQFC